MRKFLSFIILILMLVVPAVGFAQQNRPAPNKPQQNKGKIVGSPTAKTQTNTNKMRTTAKTTDKNDEYSGVLVDIDPPTKPKPKAKPKAKAKNDIDTATIMDEEEMSGKHHETDNNPILFDENPQDKESNVYEYSPFMMPQDDDLKAFEEENNDIVTPSYALSHTEDPGTESEDDILIAEESGSTVHLHRTDITNMQPVTVKLADPDMGKNFAFPTPEKAIVTSHFGPRHRRFHYGLDLGLATGEPIYAAFDGVVRFSKYNSSYGNLIVIRHDNGLETYYAHLSRRLVTAGTHVKAGETIGLCGNTGHSRGSHLHFEMRWGGNAMNPENYVDCQNHCLISQTVTLTRESFRKTARPGYSNTSKKSGRSSNYSGDGKYYKIRSGDTLSRIAKRNGTTVSKLCKLNGMKESTVLRPGKTIRIR